MMRGSLAITIAFLLGTVGAVIGLSSVYDLAHAQGVDVGSAVAAGTIPPPPSSAAAPAPKSPLGDAAASAPAPEPVSTQPPKMQAAPPAPAASPADGLDGSDIERLWRGGAFLAAGAVALYLLLVHLRKVDPKRAFYWTSGLAALEVVVESIAIGVTPTLNLWVVGAVTLIGLLARGPGSLLTAKLGAGATPMVTVDDALTQPTSQPTPLPAGTGTVIARDPEHGAARVDVLVMLFGLVLACIVAGGALSSCAASSTVARSAADFGGDVVDCAAGETPAITYQLGPMADAVIRYATGADGTIDQAPIREAAKNAKSAAAGCLWAEAFVRAMAPLAASPGAPQVAPLAGDPDALRATFDAIRGAQLGGARFKTSSGVL